MNEEFFKSDIGQKLLRDTLQEIIKQTDEEKIELHKRILLNAFKKPDLGNALIVEYFELLKRLESTQLRILSSLFQPDEIVRQIFERIKGNRDNVTDFALKRNLQEILEIDPLLFETASIKLEAENLISTEGKTTLWCAGGYRNTELEEGMRTMAKGAHELLTQYGIKFIKFATREL